MFTITDTTTPVTPGQQAIVETNDGYVCQGQIVGLMKDPQTGQAMIRVLGRDRLERRVPAPVRVTPLIARR